MQLHPYLYGMPFGSGIGALLSLILIVSTMKQITAPSFIDVFLVLGILFMGIVFGALLWPLTLIALVSYLFEMFNIQSYQREKEKRKND